MVVVEVAVVIVIVCSSNNDNSYDDINEIIIVVVIIIIIIINNKLYFTRGAQCPTGYWVFGALIKTNIQFQYRSISEHSILLTLGYL